MTGGAGFIGSFVHLDLLAREEQVVNADVRPLGVEQAWLLGSDAQRVTHAPCDVTDLSAVIEAFRNAKPDRVIHTAGVMWGDHRRIIELNLHGTLNVLEACRLLDINKVVCFSSIGVLAPAQHERLDTRHPVLLPDVPPFNGFYSLTKISAEAAAWAYTTTFGMDVTVIRPCTVYGFGESPALRIRPMIENALASRPTRFADGRDIGRSYTHAADVADVAVRAAFHETKPGGDRIFFAGTDGPLVTLGQVAEIVADLVPDADIEIGAETTEAGAREQQYRRAVDITSTREQLGYSPRFLDLRDGLADSVDRYRAYLSA
ncbi:MAG: NAD(P)-dependent oxidoreductase [Ilumatobacteraceae bacterium]